MSASATPAHHGGLTAESLAEYSGISPRQLRNIAKAGYFPPPEHGVYKQAGPTLVGMIKYLKEQRAKKTDSLKREQEALTKARRETAEHELAVARGEFIPRGEVGPAFRNVGLHQRAVILRKYEQELAPKLAGRSTLEILEMIREANDDVLAAFREGVRGWMDAPPA